MTVSIYYGDEMPKRKPVQITGAAPFRILVLADLGASAPSRKPLAVDRDDLDGVIDRLAVQGQFQLEEDGPVAELRSQL